jgi:5'(3')-deoxyribonucleotidase
MQIFLDCDGVLADFDTRFEELSGETSRGFEDKFGQKAFWKVVMSDDSFFANLPVMPDAHELVDAVRHLNPIILTGCPQGSWSQPQKQLWRYKNFPDLPMITCMSRDKFQYMVPMKNNILIDDWPKYQTIWEDNGGTFLLHTSAKDSIQKLKRLGVLNDSETS